MNALSLFSGIGGIDLACEWAGIKTVAFCEREPFCQKVLRKHWPNVPIYDDVCTLTKARLDADGIGPIDLIHGGYPCQPFSYAGKRRGAEDDRHLWPEVARLLSEIRPRWFVGENVAGHVTLGLDDVLADLESLDYTAQAFVIPAAAVYASHRRDRVFIVAYCNSERHDGGGREIPPVSDRNWEKDRLPVPDGENVAYAACELSYRGRGEGRRWDEHSDGGEVVADPEGKRRNAWGPKSAGQQRESGSAIGDSSLAHANGGQCNAGAEVKGILRALPADGTINRDTGGRGSAQSRENVADTDYERRQQRDVTASGEGLGHHSWGAYAGGIHERRRTTKSRMGRGADELSAWLDGGMNPLDALSDFVANFPQPALMGQPQYEWEPPRVATGIKNRAARLKALGNAVDPLQIFPIMYAIKIIDDWVMSQ